MTWSDSPLFILFGGFCDKINAHVLPVARTEVTGAISGGFLDTPRGLSTPGHPNLKLIYL